MKRIAITILICSLTIISYASQYTVGNHEVESTLLATGKFEAAASQVSVINRSLVVTGKAIADAVALKPTTSITVCASNSMGQDTCDYTCDGTDDDVQIQAASDEIRTSGASFGEVFYTEGTYSLKDTINIVNHSSVHTRMGWKGVLGGGTFFIAQSNFADDGDTVMIQFSEVTAPTTAGFFIQDIWFNGGDDLAENPLTIASGTSIGGIDTEGTDGNELWDLNLLRTAWLDFGETAIVVDDPFGFRFINSIVEDCSQGGIEINRGTQNQGALIAFSKIITNADDANAIEQFGIRASGVTSVRIIGNEIETEHADGWGVELVGSDFSMIADNNFGGGSFSKDGILVDSTSDGNLIIGNSFVALTGNGITVQSGANLNIITNNILDSISGTEISDSGTNTDIFGNKGNDDATKQDFRSNDLRFQGAGNYLIDSNTYVYRAQASENFGLFFNFTDARWEWQDASTTPLVTIGAVSGKLGVLTATPRSTFEVVGSQSASWITVTSDTTLDATQFNVYASIETVPFTITLPAASSVGGRIYSIKKIDSFASSITVDGNGSDQIDNALTFDLISQYESITIQSDSEKWWIF